MLALVAAVGYGVSDFVGGVASRRVAALRVVIVSYPVSVAIVLALAPLFGGTFDPASLAWGFASGIASAVAVWWFYLALAEGPMSVVSPLTAILVAGIPVLIGLMMGERPGLLALVGIALALVAVVLVSRESPDNPLSESTDGQQLRFTRRVALLTVGSGIAFAFMFVFLHQVGEGTGLWPLAASRLSATAVIWAVAFATAQFVAPRGRTLRLAVYIAVLDVIGNAAMMFALQGSMLSMVSVLGSLYPAATVLLAMVVLDERVASLQKVGMAVALGAVGLIAVS
ncbi:DMT family transporter [Aldersonia sp. NBC_00410]|uniref:DMT family transporter n=1 Tax=Aldersonia sp. NBC_00410 TaxID=2975954 RepID=UPI002251E04B|nr:DMT family transporter [Aldersonia sp. NBC_00410]MCX5044639.1 DMT family transporter [Aldersonia sp. NBC_00410]